jgi:L,D-transpeptidase ErfK/SrfK
MVMKRSDEARRTLVLWVSGLVILLGVALGGCRKGNDAAQATPGRATVDTAVLRKRVESLRKENERLQARLDKLIPKEPYVVVNTTLNRIYLRKGDAVLLDAICSTGSNTELTSPDGSKKWFFASPRGVFKVRNRMERPVWVRPDWAFVEEGEPIPPPNSPERYEEGVLGDYALYIGDGFLIHGTLFQRFLGQAVTHGCIRVGDDDLAQIWKATRVGTPVYIF